MSINDRGRKRSNEWNSNEALKLNREIKERIKKINEEKRLKEPDIINSSNIANTQKKPYSSKSEKLYIELCLDFPEYESYITRHHNLNPSYETMKIIKEKIYSDLNLDEYGR